MRYFIVLHRNNPKLAWDGDYNPDSKGPVRVFTEGERRVTRLPQHGVWKRVKGAA